MWFINAAKQWWHSSTISRWYVQRLIKKYAIQKSLYTFDNTAWPTLHEFIERKYKQKPIITSPCARPLLLPIAGIVTTCDTYRMQLTLLTYHYHRIHMPIGGKIHHYSDTQGTTTTIQIFCPDNLIVSITIATPRDPFSAKLSYNPKRNYHLPATEIGIITAAKAFITIQTNIPLLKSLPLKTDLECLSLLAAAHDYQTSTSLIRQQLV